MKWLTDVLKAAEVVKRGNFKAITHNGIAHADDTIAAALLHRAGAEAIYRLNEAEEALAVEGDVVLFDIGDSFAAGLPQRFVVLDHHSTPEESSSVIQVALAVGASPSPQVQALINFVDLFDRFGTAVKQWTGPFGNSLNRALSKYFGDATPKGLVKEGEFLSLVADAFYSGEQASLAELAAVFGEVAERLDLGDWPERFPRTFQFFGLLRLAPRDPSVLTSEEALKTGFGIDFTTYAVAAVPELEPYVMRGLEAMLSEAKKAAEVAENYRYTVAMERVIAIATEEDVSPSALYNAMIDSGRLRNRDVKLLEFCEEEHYYEPCIEYAEIPVFFVVRDRRTPGAYVLWRPDKYGSRVDFRRLDGDGVVFKHPSGFLAVVKAENAEEAARYALRYV